MRDEGTLALLLIGVAPALSAQVDDCDFNCGTFVEKARVTHAAIAIDRTVYILGGWKKPRLPGDVPMRNLTELKLGDITLDSLPRLQRWFLQGRPRCSSEPDSKRGWLS